MSDLTSFDEIALQIKAKVGYRLFTITRVLPNNTHVERIYTTDPQTYPVTGQKPIYDDAWTVMVIHEAQTYLASNSEAMIPYFPDLDVIKSLGLGSVINMPIVLNQKVVGTINILDAEGVYQKAHTLQLAPFASQIAHIFQCLYQA